MVSENPGPSCLGHHFNSRHSRDARTTRVFYHSVARHTRVTLGATLTPPTVTKITAPYARLQAVLTIPADYTSSVTIDYGTGQTRALSLFPCDTRLVGCDRGRTNAGHRCSSGLQHGCRMGQHMGAIVEPPDTWDVTATGTNVSTTQCVEGGFIKTARLSGSAN